MPIVKFCALSISEEYIQGQNQSRHSIARENSKPLVLIYNF